MVKQSIKDINPKLIKHAKGVMAVLELLGITEEDLLLLKKVPAMEQELQELREFKASTERTLSNKAESADKKPISEVLKGYTAPSKEFNPHYGGQN